MNEKEEISDDDKLPYELDDLIDRLESIRDGHSEALNFPRAFYTLALHIKRLEIFIAKDCNETR